MSKKRQGLFFSRNSNTTECSYFSAVWQIPLKDTIKLEVTINGVNPCDPYLDFGLIKANKFNAISSDPMVNFGNQTISYCGTSFYDMSGTKGTAKFQPGFVFVMEFNRSAQKLSFATKDNVVNLYCDSLSLDEEYYFFLTLYYPESACTIRTIK